MVVMFNTLASSGSEEARGQKLQYSKQKLAQFDSFSLLTRSCSGALPTADIVW